MSVRPTSCRVAQRAALGLATEASIAEHPAVAEVLERWEHVLLPIVLIGIGLAVLVEGGAFGL